MLFALFTPAVNVEALFFNVCRETHESIGLLKSGNLMGDLL